MLNNNFFFIKGSDLRPGTKDDISQSNFVTHSTIWRESSRSQRDKKYGGEQIRVEPTFSHV